MRLSSIYHFKALREFLALAFPIIVSNSSDSVMLFFDRLFLSQYSMGEGEIYINASLIGALTTYMIAGVFLVTCAYSNALVSQFVGAKKPEQASTITIQSVYLALTVYPLILLIAYWIGDFYTFFGHSPRQTELETTYTQILLVGSLFMIIRGGLSGFFIGIGKSNVVMYSNLLGMVANIPLNYLLIFGYGPIPDLGIRGAAIATIIASLLSLIYLLVLYLNKNNREQYLTHRQFGFNPKFYLKLWYYGSPSGVELFFGLGAFNYFIMSMSSYGPTIGAAATIAINWDMMVFIPMLGINAATMALVGRNLGAKNIDGARNIVFLALVVTITYSLVLGLLFFAFTGPLVNMFLGQMGNPDEVYGFAFTLVRLITIYVIADAVHITIEGALKGAGDTTAVMILFMSIAMIFGITIHLLVKSQVVGPLTAWYIFIAYATSLGVAMVVRYLQGKWKTIDMVNS